MKRAVMVLTLAALALFGCEGGSGTDNAPGADTNGVGSDAVEVGDAGSTATPDSVTAPADTPPGVDLPRADTEPADVPVPPEDAVANDTGSDEDVPPVVVPTLPNRVDGLEWLLVTTDELADAFAPLVERRRHMGLAAQLVTLSEIEALADGPDTPARIRAYLTERAAATDLRFVLIGGDSTVVPPRVVHGTADVPSESTFVDAWVASDLYYADLDGDWDADGDRNYAELEDDLELRPDLALGRLPVETPAEVATWLAKLEAWEEAHNPDYQDKALFLGEWAGYSATGSPIYSSPGLEMFLKPNVPSHIDLTRHYEDWEDYDGAQPNTAASQRTAFEEGQALVIDFGHGNVPTLCNLAGDEILSLRDTGRPSVYWTTECYSGMFDAAAEPCGGELYIRAAGGGVAYLGNTDFGVGFPSLMNLYMRLVQQLYRAPDARIGVLVMDALANYSTDGALQMQDNPDRFTNLTFELLGDPAMRMWTGAVVAASADVQTEGDLATVTVQGPDGPVAGATVTLYAPGELLVSADTNADGVVLLRTSAPLPADFTVTLHGANVPLTQL